MVDFFSEGVLETAENSVNKAQRLVRIGVEDTARIQTLGRLAGSCLQVHQALKRRPVSTILSMFNYWMIFGLCLWFNNDFQGGLGLGH